jgi:mannose-1-phosphate guanylyltransferase/phosphomannomutase
MFSLVKLLEMLSKYKKSLSEILKEIPDFRFKHITIGCPSKLKGKIMRKFTEEAVDKEASFVDGVKIFLGKGNWVLMIPDEYEESVHLYVQAKTEKEAEKILKEYTEKVNKWINE